MLWPTCKISSEGGFLSYIAQSLLPTNKGSKKEQQSDTTHPWPPCQESLLPSKLVAQEPWTPVQLQPGFSKLPSTWRIQRGLFHTRPLSLQQKRDSIEKAREPWELSRDCQ